MAVFLDLENIALGAHDAQFPAFDIRKVLERLLLKGHIVVKKAYCDFDRYKAFKRGLHEAAFEMIEIPHVRQSGKNSADIRMVVDALDLCYTKSHVDTFVIISGDSDFSPLVSKLRENAKTVIGVGVKKSTSDLFINNCDEFIYYDDLVRGGRRPGNVARAPPAAAAESRAGQKTRVRPIDEAPRSPEQHARCLARRARRRLRRSRLAREAGDQAPASRLQRARLRFSHLQRFVGGGAEARFIEPRKRQERRRLFHSSG